MLTDLHPLQRGLFFVLCVSVLASCTPSPVANTPSLISIATDGGFELIPPGIREQSFLHLSLRGGQQTALKSTILLREDDRIASVHWYEDPDAERIMNEITERAFSSFSTQMTDLVDELLEVEGYAPIDILAFTDPLMSEERFLFARIDDTIYEFHMAKKGEPWVQGLLLELARK